MTPHKDADPVYEKLKAVRKSKTVSLQPIEMFRREIVGLDGAVLPFTLRYYQVQAIYHLLARKRMVLGDAAGSGKTISTLGGICYQWVKEPDNKVMIVTPKTALRQWEAEIHRFTQGVKVFVANGTPKQRYETYLEFATHEGPEKPIMLLTYGSLTRDWHLDAHQPLLENGKPDPKQPLKPGRLDGITSKIKSLVTVFDEAQAFKSDRTKIWEVVSQLSGKSHRSYGLTATLLGNDLMEGFFIFKAINPKVFGSTKTAFYNLFCHTQLQKIPGGRKVPIVVGYKNLELYRQTLDPHFLGRHKHEISDELPTLITKEVSVPLDKIESLKYQEALEGVVQLGDGEYKDFEETKALTSLIYCQKAVDSLSLLKFNEDSEVFSDVFRDEVLNVKEIGSKEQALMDLLQDEFDGQKVIVYCRFASLIPRLQKLSDKIGIKSVAITGAVTDTKNNPARRKAQEAFQNLKNDVKVVYISDAASEAVNLQAASGLIFYNAPWSWGRYVQIVGRAIRIGSPHQHVLAIHLVAERPDADDPLTIDHYTLATLQKKKSIIDKVLGESAQGALDFDKGEGGSFARQLARSLRKRNA